MTSLHAGMAEWKKPNVDGTFALAKQGGASIGKTKRGKGSKIMAIADRQGLQAAVKKK